MFSRISAASNIFLYVSRGVNASFNKVWAVTLTVLQVDAEYESRSDLVLGSWVGAAVNKKL